MGLNNRRLARLDGGFLRSSDLETLGGSIKAREVLAVGLAERRMTANRSLRPGPAAPSRH